LQTITDPYGRQVQLSYDANDQLETITDPNMQFTTIDYANDGNDLWKITDPEGYILTYDYDPNSRMTTATLKDGQTWTCNYVGGKPNSLIDPNSDTYVTVTNSQNWARDFAHPDSNEFRYSPSQTTVTDGEGNITTFDLDENGYVTEAGHPGHPNEVFVFNSDLRLTEIIDQENNHWLYTYDANGNLTDANDPLNNYTEMFYEHPTIPSLCTRIIEPDGDIWQFEWDLQANLTNITDPIAESPADKVITYSYIYYPGPPNGRFQFVTRTDRNDHTKQWEFDPNGNIIRTVADLGGLDLTTEYEHDAVGRMTRKTVFREAGGPNTVVTSYTYDSLGRLIESVLDPTLLNFTTQYEYDGCGRLVRITNPRGIATEYDYDYRGRLVDSAFDPCGLALTTGYSYDGCDRRIKTTDAKANQTNYEYDSLNRLIKIVDAEGYWTEYEYDERSNLTLSKRTFDPGIPPYRSIEYEYDGLNRLIQLIVDPCDLALSTQIQYAPSGGGGGGRGTPGTPLVHKITDAEGKVTYNYYDNLDRLSSVVNKVGDTSDNGGDPDDAITNYEYDYMSNPTQVTIENAPEPNLVTVYTYDAADRLIQQVEDPCDANLVTSYAYDGTCSVVRHDTRSANVITYNYDNANRLTDVNDSIGSIVSYTYDENGNILTKTDGLSHSWTYTYDNADRVTDACDPLTETPDDKYTSYEYDKNSNMTKMTDNEGLLTDYEYDGLNRLISTTKDPCDLSITIMMVYDGFGNKTVSTDNNGNTTGYDYDGANRLIREAFADGTEMFFDYDGVSNLITETDQMGNITTYSYDDLHCPISRTYADSNEDTFTHDRACQMLSADNNHSHIGHTFDGAGRITSSTQTDLPQSYSYAVSYGYTTEPNNTRTIIYPDGNEVTEIYDVRDRLIEVERDGSTVALYTYDDPGNRLLSKNFANGSQSQYSYNDNDWVTKLVHKAPDDSNLAGFEYGYDAVGNCLSAVNLQTVLAYDDTKPVTHSEAFTYDSIYRLTDSKRGQWVSDDIPSPIRQRNWTFDSVSNWQEFSIQDIVNPGENGTYSNSINQMNEYDDPSTNDPAPVPDDDGKPDDFMVNANPLAGDSEPDGIVGFDDLAVIALHWVDGCSGPGWCEGADIDLSTDVDFVDYGYLALNWLDSVPGFYNSAHDKNGNLVDDDVAEYYWDYDHRPVDTATLRARNLLTQVRCKSDDQILGEYLYDALGRRIRKSAGGASTVFVYGGGDRYGWQVVEEYEDAGFARSFTYGSNIDEVIAMDNAADQRFYYHPGGVNSTIAATDGSGTVTECYNYDSYGQPSFFDADGNEIPQSVIENPYLFTSRRYDGETGLYYYRTRYLHPQRGRFISRDAIGIWGDTMNLGNGYAYVGNNPASYDDPFGFQGGVKFGPPLGTKRKKFVFQFKYTSLKALRKANIIISVKDARNLKRTHPAAKILTKCGVIIINGGAITGHKG
jgi:RHS repeat-associated protein